MPGTIALIVPTLTTPGPAYATQISNDLTTIAGHTHDGVNNGATIDIAAQTVGEDLSLIHHNLSNVRSVELDNEPAQLTGSQDVLCLYVNQGNLGFNTSDGTFVPITQGDSLAPSALATFLSWIMRNGGVPITANASILYTDTYNFVAVDSSGGAITITLPIAAQITPVSVRVGRIYVIRDATGSAGTHSITVQVAVGSGNTFADDGSTSFTINTNGGYVAIYTDGVSRWFTWSQNAFQGEQIGYNSSTLQVKGGSAINVDATSQIQNQGQFGQLGGIFGLVGSTNTINGGTVAVDGSAAVTWSGGATEIFATGTSETFQGGSTLTCDGVLTGTTTGGTLVMNNTLECAQAATFDNFVNMAAGARISCANGSQISGLLEQNGLGMSCVGSSSLGMDSSCSIANFGSTQLGGALILANRLITPGTTTLLDADYYVGVQTSLTGTFTVNMPASPVNGRVIIFGDVTGGSATFSLVINGNGRTIGLSIVGGGASSSITISSAAFTSPGLSNFWSIGFIFIGSNWAPYFKHLTNAAGDPA